MYFSSRYIFFVYFDDKYFRTEGVLKKNVKFPFHLSSHHPFVQSSTYNNQSP